MEKSRTAVVTGGEGGLGSALADALGDAGYRVHAPGRSDLDVRSAESVSDFFSRFDSIDLLINNAGVARDGLHLRLLEEEWDAVVDTNLKGAFLCSKAALRLFPRKTGGHIINVGSFSGKNPPLGQSNYATAKEGLLGLTKSLAKEYGKRNIRVNLVLPGFLETRMTSEMPDAAVESVLARHSLGRLNTIEDAARFMVCLDGMKNVSGQVFQLDSRV